MNNIIITFRLHIDPSFYITHASVDIRLGNIKWIYNSYKVTNILNLNLYIYFQYIYNLQMFKIRSTYSKEGQLKLTAWVIWNVWVFKFQEWSMTTTSEFRSRLKLLRVASYRYWTFTEIHYKVRVYLVSIVFYWNTIIIRYSYSI